MKKPDKYEELLNEIDVLKLRVEQLKEVNQSLRRAHWKTVEHMFINKTDEKAA